MDNQDEIIYYKENVIYNNTTSVNIFLTNKKLILINNNGELILEKEVDLLESVIQQDNNYCYIFKNNSQILLSNIEILNVINDLR